MSDYHRFPSVVELALVPLLPEDEGVLFKQRGTPLSDRARPTVSRIGRTQLEVRDALWAVLEAVSGLERTVDWLRGTTSLRDRGIELKPELVLIGADGLELQRPGAWSDGQDVRVFLTLHVREVQHLMSLTGCIEQRDSGAFVRFTELRGDERDLLVAFVFQQEAKERRRALDTPGHA